MDVEATDPHLAVIVVNYGSSDLLERNLAPLARHTPTARVVVVDNFTTAAEQARVTDLCARLGWTAVTMSENVGFGAAINRAAAGLPASIRSRLLLNPDATIDAVSLARLVDHSVRHPLDLVAPRVLTPEGTVWSAGTDLYLDDGHMRGWRHRDAATDPAGRQPWLSGACLVLGRELWDRVGGFDEDYFLYWEDVDFSRRVLDRGGSLVLDEHATAVHDVGSTQRTDGRSTRAKSPVYYYFNTRNRLLFAAKHLSRGDQRRWQRSSLLMAYRILLIGGRRQFRHPAATFLPAARGTLAGLVLMRRERRSDRCRA